MNLVFLVSTFILTICYVYCQGISVGDVCTVRSTGAAGQCQLIGNCPTAIHGLRNQGITPQTCGFQGPHPIVCCVENVQHPPVTTNTTIKPTTTVPTVTRVQGPCTTPGGEQGECVFIDDCPPLANVFANPINGSLELLNNFKCNKQTYLYVCCISGWNSTNYGNKLSDRRYCGYQHTDDYFPTGNTTSIDEFPWLAALVGYDPDIGQDRVLCLGSLINNRYILTAAHCMFMFPLHGRNNVSKVLLGKYHTTENTTSCVDLEGYGVECTEVQEFGVEEIILHLLYSKRNALCDIALIRMNKTTSYTDYIRPICLPTQGTKVAEVGEILYTTGWGTVDLGGQLSAVKKKVKTILVTSAECQETYTNLKVSSKFHMCILDSKNNTEFSCIGDEGAPVMFSYRNQWQIEGIMSKGILCGAKYPTLYTRVSPYIDWIKQNIRP